MYDWICFSQFLGKFEHLEKDPRSKIVAHLFERDRIVDEKEVQGKEENLNSRQKQQTGASSDIATQHSKLEDIQNDQTYHTGDYVYVRTADRFGQIEALLVIDGGSEWADISIFDEHQRDFESGIVYANDDLPDVYKMYRLSDLSCPLVTCEKRNIRWFISFSTDDEKFQWYDGHISL